MKKVLIAINVLTILAAALTFLLLNGRSKYEDQVRYHFDNPATVEFVELHEGQDSEGIPVVCGELTAENGAGARKTAFFYGKVTDSGFEVASVTVPPKDLVELVGLRSMHSAAADADILPSNMPIVLQKANRDHAKLKARTLAKLKIPSRGR